MGVDEDGVERPVSIEMTVVLGFLIELVSSYLVVMSYVFSPIPIEGEPATSLVYHLPLSEVGGPGTGVGP